MLRNAPAKPLRGTFRRERLARRLTLEAREAREKTKVRQRDGYRCRWPHAPGPERDLCRRTRLEVAHVRAKSLGHENSTAAGMMLLCEDVHQGPLSLHQGNRRVVFLTCLLCNGPVAFEEKRAGRWVQIHFEVEYRSR